MPAGRPYKEISKKEFEKLCALHCTLIEISDWFDCDENTVEAWCQRTYKKNFSEVLKLKKGKGKISLRRSQWKLAETNAAMAIFLGKQYLGQSDNPQSEEATAKTINALLEAVKNVD